MTLSEDIKRALSRSVDPVAAVQLMDFATEEEARAACEYAIDLAKAIEVFDSLDRNHAY